LLGNVIINAYMFNTAKRNMFLNKKLGLLLFLLP
jgi:hypothetical protein